MEPVLEVIESRGADRPRRRWPLIVGMVLVLLALAGWATDEVLRTRETEAIATARQSALDEISQGRLLVDGLTEYASPLLRTGPTSVRSALRQIVSEGAATALDQIATHRNALAAVSIVPWHTDIHAQRAQALADIDAQSAPLVAARDTP
jgi:hypothetical protein